MAQIPIQDEPSVASAPLSPPVNGPAGTGMLDGFAQATKAIGNEVSQITDVAADVYKKAKEKADDQAVYAAQNEFHKTGENVYYAADGGLLNQRGAAGVDATPSADLLEKERLKIRENLLQTDAQRAKFDKLSQDLSLSYHRAGEVHAATQREVVSKSNLKTAKALTLGDLAQNYGDKDSNLEARLGAIDDQIDRSAFNPQQAEAEKLEWRGNAYGLILNKRINAGHLQEAQDLFDRPDVQKALGAIGGKDHYEGTLQKSAFNAEGKKLGDNILSEATLPGPFGGVDEATALAKLEGMEEGPAKAIAAARVKAMVPIMMKAREQAAALTFNEGLTALQHNNYDMTAIPSTVIQSLSDKNGAPKLLEDLKNIAEAQMRFNREGKHEAPSPQQNTAFGGLINEMATDPQTFKSMDPAVFDARYHGALGEQHFLSATQKLAEIKKTSDKDLGLTGTKENIITEMFQEAFHEKKSDFKSWSPKSQEYWPIVHDYVQRNATQWTRDHHGQEPPEEQIRAWATDKLKTQVIESGHWYVPNKKGPAVKMEAEASATAPDTVHTPAPTAGNAGGTIKVKSAKTGKTGRMPAAGADAWLKTHTDWAKVP